MGVARRAGVALAQPEAADKAIALLVIGELETHAIGIVFAAGEAVVLLQADVTRVVAAACGFLRQSVKSIKPRRTQGYAKETYPQESYKAGFVIIELSTGYVPDSIPSTTSACAHDGGV